MLRKVPGMEDQSVAPPCGKIVLGGGIMLRAGVGTQYRQKRSFAHQGRQRGVLETGNGTEWKKHKSNSLLLLECIASYCF